MIVMILENVPISLRGELTRWLLEPKAGVFVGHVSALVRDKLWEKCCDNISHRRGGESVGSVTQIWSTNTEQRFAMRSTGDASREVVDFEGLFLVRHVPRAKAKQAAAK